MPKYMIFGGKGMLAYAIKTNPFFHDHIALDLPECDITNKKNIENYVNKYSPEYLINCAAYTDVAKAEMELEKAKLVNSEAVKNLAEIACDSSLKLVHYSTDFVFKGDKDIIYDEDMPTNPVNNYGLSKLRGEEYITTIIPEALIIRLSWLYGPNGKNFVSVISSLLEEKSKLDIVADQFGKTTYTIDAIEATKNLINCKAKGIYHFANEGVCSRFQFTAKILDILNRKKDIKCIINPIKAIEYNDQTPRPTWSILGCDKYQKTTGKNIQVWKEALTEYLLN